MANYIHRLESATNEARNLANDTSSEIDDLTRYLQSEKFRCGSDLDGYVSVRDVLNRLQGIRSGVIAIANLRV